MKTETKQELRDRIAQLEEHIENKQVEDGDVPTLFGVRLDQVGEIHDPWGIERGNPFSFKNHPPGMRLHWCREDQRNKQGWDGFVPVTWEDEIAENLEDYCYEAPKKLDTQSDSAVRRGDTILCKIPVEAWLARQLRRVNRASQAKRDHMTPEQDLATRNNEGEFGPGLTESERPEGGFRMLPEEVSDDRHDGNPLRIMSIPMDGTRAGDNAKRDADGED